jgi:hypothetical protein
MGTKELLDTGTLRSSYPGLADLCADDGYLSRNRVETLIACTAYSTDCLTGVRVEEVQAGEQDSVIYRQVLCVG